MQVQYCMRGGGRTLADLLDLVYPIGSIYMNTNNVNPQSIFGGSWQKIEGRFLLGSSSNYTLGLLGGEAYHTLTQSELPNYDLMGLKWSNDWPITLDSGTSGSGYKLNYQYGVYNADQTLGFRMNSGGGNQPHNNMPPYLTVNIWKRTA